MVVKYDCLGLVQVPAMLFQRTCPPKAQNKPLTSSLSALLIERVIN